MKKEALKDENHLLTTASGSTNITRNFFTLFSISTRGLNECMIVCMSVRNGILFERGRIIWETATILGQKNKS